MREYPEISLAEEEALKRAAPLILTALCELPGDMLEDIIHGDKAAITTLKVYAQAALDLQREQ